MVRTDDERRTDDEAPTPEDVLPDGTVRVELLHRELRARLGDWEVPDGVNVTEDTTTVVFEAGDDIPLGLAAKSWPAFNDRLAAYDTDDERVDTPSVAEQHGFDQSVTGIR